MDSGEANTHCGIPGQSGARVSLVAAACLMLGSIKAVRYLCDTSEFHRVSGVRLVAPDALLQIHACACAHSLTLLFRTCLRRNSGLPSHAQCSSAYLWVFGSCFWWVICDLKDCAISLLADEPAIRELPDLPDASTHGSWLMQHAEMQSSSEIRAQEFRVKVKNVLVF